MPQQKNAFLETIYHLRTIEQVILYNKLLAITVTEEKEVVDFLETEYEREALNYPFEAPVFNAKASIWASKIVYFSAQLLLYREHKEAELNSLLPDFDGIIDASALLSADLCLRFLPQIVLEIDKIDPEDVVLNLLNKKLETFHYSAIGFELPAENLRLDGIFENPCLKQLYLDRIVEKKAHKLTLLPQINESLKANFGDYKKYFFPEMFYGGRL